MPVSILILWTSTSGKVGGGRGVAETVEGEEPESVRAFLVAEDEGGGLDSQL